MASPRLRRPENAPGAFFVDESCIDCDACRWIAPATFDRAGDQSRVHTQPTDEAQAFRAMQALVACPTSSIGASSAHDVRAAADSFPEPVPGADADAAPGSDAIRVYHCGYHLEGSFGAASWLVTRPAGNVLVDSPRFSGPLLKNIEALGGVDTMFLTHRDDAGEHARFAERFSARRVIHAADADGDRAACEVQLEGTDAIDLAPDLRVVPVPGHTRGSACLIVGGRFLFSGDHVAWSAGVERIYAFRSACWYDWDVQIDSMRRLARERFAWILPGHGRQCRFEPEEMSRRVADCAEWMESVR